MAEKFKFEIISPEKIIFSDEVSLVTLPSYEGEMGIMKNHISIITFLRPGLIKIQKNDKSEDKIFVEDGTVEYNKDSLIALSSSAINLKDIQKDFIDQLSQNTQSMLEQKDINDHDRYILNHKLLALNEIRI